MRSVRRDTGGKAASCKVGWAAGTEEESRPCGAEGSGEDVVLDLIGRGNAGREFPSRKRDSPEVNQEQGAGRQCGAEGRGREVLGPCHGAWTDFGGNEKPPKGVWQDGDKMQLCPRWAIWRLCLEGGKSAQLGPCPLLVGRRMEQPLWKAKHGPSTSLLVLNPRELKIGVQSKT